MSERDRVDVPSTDALAARVVCGVDGTPQALEAVRQAKRLARAGSTILLVSVSDPHLVMRTGQNAWYFRQQLQCTAQNAIDEAEAVARDSETLVLAGRPADALLQVIVERDATLLAVGPHGTSRVAGILLGSVATRVVHDAPCSVLLSRAPTDLERWPRSIVAGVDGSQASLAAASVARDLGKRLHASVQFVVGRYASNAEVALDVVEASGLEVTVADTKPAEALLERAHDADLLVLGSRGLTGLRSLGSVSEHVAHHATCSVLVVRARPAS